MAKIPNHIMRQAGSDWYVSKFKNLGDGLHAVYMHVQLLNAQTGVVEFYAIAQLRSVTGTILMQEYTVPEYPGRAEDFYKVLVAGGVYAK